MLSARRPIRRIVPLHLLLDHVVPETLVFSYWVIYTKVQLTARNTVPSWMPLQQDSVSALYKALSTHLAALLLPKLYTLQSPASVSA